MPTITKKRFPSAFYANPDGKLPVRRPGIPGSLSERQATDKEQEGWTDAQRAANTCMHCQTAYKTGSGAAWVCEHYHEGLL